MLEIQHTFQGLSDFMQSELRYLKEQCRFMSTHQQNLRPHFLVMNEHMKKM